MNGPRELFTTLLRLNQAVFLRGNRLMADLHNRFLALYLPAAGMLAAVLLKLDAIATTVLQDVSQPLFLLNDVAMTTFSTMDAMTVVTVYSLYVWTDTILQSVQQLVATPSAELSIKGDIPGGIAVWLFVAFALMTYAFVYHQYPTHKDWVATVFSIVLPLLYQSLWRD